MIEKKSPSTFDNKIVNCSHQTTIFHWNWKEKLRFVGGLVVHLQKFPPNLGRIGCVSQVINPTNLNFSFQFQWKMVVWWLQFSILLSNLLGLFFLSLHAWDNCDLPYKFYGLFVKEMQYYAFHKRYFSLVYQKVLNNAIRLIRT